MDGPFVTAEQSARDRLLVVIAFAVLMTSIWSASGTLDALDSGIRARVAHQLWTTGRLTVASQGGLEAAPMFEDKNGTYPSKFGIGQSLFFIPFDLAASAIADYAPGLPQRDRMHSAILSMTVFFVVLAANVLLAFFIAKMVGADEFTALAIAVMATFGTSFWQMAKAGQEEAELGPLVLASIFFYLRWNNVERVRPVWLAACSACAGLLFRVTFITNYVGTLALFLASGKKTGRQVLMIFCCSLLGSLTILATYNWFKTGSPFRTGYEPEFVDMAKSNWLAGLIGPIVGLDRGLIVTDPMLFALAIGCVLGWRSVDRRAKALVFFSIFIYLAAVIGYCRWTTWPGDICYGSRFEIHALPTLCLTLAVVTCCWLRGRITSAIKYRATLLGITLSMVVLQLPSIAFCGALEWYQSVQHDPACWNATGSPTHELGQVRLRYINTISKVATGRILDVPKSPPERVSPLAIAQASRWNFWPWLVEARLSDSLVRMCKNLWAAILISSAVVWTLALHQCSRMDQLDRPCGTN